MSMLDKPYKISRVNRKKEDAERYYNSISPVYDWLGGAFERRPAEKTLRYLDVKSSETVLEIGVGTGHCFRKLALLVGNNGKAFGIDISQGMLEITRKRLHKLGLIDRAKLYQNDATKLPFTDETFDAIFISFTLELFDTPEIPLVLNETKRVLKKGGRMGIVSLSKAKGDSIIVRIYECIHAKWPILVDCRPIYLENSVREAGYTIKRREIVNLFLLPLEIVIAVK
jgi:ubiquinone/menaquinone biosynthesis C-methylase UbiE